MVTIKYNGRFGNCLFQYFLGRIIAEEKGLTIDQKGFDEQMALQRERFTIITL